MTSFPIAQLERLSRKRLPGYLDACRACAVEVTDKAMTFDTSLPCWGELARFRMYEPPKKSRGLGDTISRVTAALGIKECGGCAKRRAALNRLIPYQ